MELGVAIAWSVLLVSLMGANVGFQARVGAMTWAGVKAGKTLTGEGTMVNVTLCFSANQALLAAKAGETFISPVRGRLDDTGADGMEVVREIRTIYDNYADLKTQILAASIRNVLHVKQAALIGADVATVPPAVLPRARHASADRQGSRRYSRPTGRRPASGYDASACGGLRMGFRASLEAARATAPSLSSEVRANI